MIATVNLPGSSHFEWYHGTKKECEKWLEKMADTYRERFEGAWYNAYSPANIITDKESRKWRWRDGDKVFNI